MSRAGASLGERRRRAGWCAREVEQELPGLRLLVREVEVGARGLADAATRRRTSRRACANCPTACAARARSAMRREPVPAAYRVFFRHIGLDPDVERTPIEAAVLERMLRGGFLTGGLLEDVLLIALLDTGVPVWALDADARRRAARHPRERRGRAARARGERAAAAARAAGGRRRRRRRSRCCSASSRPGTSRGRARARLALFAVQVAGVPTLYAEEALWSCAARSALAEPALTARVAREGHARRRW